MPLRSLIASAPRKKAYSSARFDGLRLAHRCCFSCGSSSISRIVSAPSRFTSRITLRSSFGCTDENQRPGFCFKCFMSATKKRSVSVGR